jgi:opacity protein-like surface antigen
MPKLKIISLVLTISAFLSAAPQTNNLIITQSYKRYSGQSSAGSEDSAFASHTFALNGEYDFHITDGWKILTGVGIDIGKTYAFLAEVGVKKYLNDNVYLGGACVIPLGVGEENIHSSGSWTSREKHTIIGYKPTLSLFAGAELGDDWVAEVQFRRTTYEVRREILESGSKKLSDIEMDSANELSFALGLIF